MKYCINFDSSDVDIRARAKEIKTAGFDGVFLFWKRDGSGNYKKAAAVRENGLFIETLHTEFHGINDMWLPGINGDSYLEYFKKTVDEAAELAVPTLIVHLSSGNNPPAFNPVGERRYASFAEYAAQKGIVLAFENLRKISYLENLFGSINGDNVKFCFDIGHENIYNGGRGVLELYGDRLAAFHIHDNFASGDDHLLPFDGNINWHRAAERIKKYTTRLPLTVEAYVAANGAERYNKDTFYRTAFERITRLSAMM